MPHSYIFLGDTIQLQHQASRVTDQRPTTRNSQSCKTSRAKEYHTAVMRVYKLLLWSSVMELVRQSSLQLLGHSFLDALGEDGFGEDACRAGD